MRKLCCSEIGALPSLLLLDRGGNRGTAYRGAIAIGGGSIGIRRSSGDGSGEASLDTEDDLLSLLIR